MFYFIGTGEACVLKEFQRRCYIKQWLLLSPLSVGLWFWLLTVDPVTKVLLELWLEGWSESDWQVKREGVWGLDWDILISHVTPAWLSSYCFLSLEAHGVSPRGPLPTFLRVQLLLAESTQALSGGFHPTCSSFTDLFILSHRTERIHLCIAP